jgi:hypothetical protein
MFSQVKGDVQFELPKSNTYRRRAEECRKLAKIASNHVRESYIKVADEYERLAELEGARVHKKNRPPQG